MLNESNQTSAARFASTRWSLIAAADPLLPSANAALENLCELYWRPIYAFLRRKGLTRQDAQDTTQEFFAIVLRREFFSRVRPGTTKFRSFLLTALTNHLRDQERSKRALKRGGATLTLPLEEVAAEEIAVQKFHRGEPEAVFDRRWAELVVARTVEDLRGEFLRKGKGPMFEALQVFLSQQPESAVAAEIGARLSMTQEALATAVHRLRKRFRVVLRMEIARTVASDADIDGEMRYLLLALS